jgi:hypothetical protein
MLEILGMTNIFIKKEIITVNVKEFIPTCTIVGVNIYGIFRN